MEHHPFVDDFSSQESPLIAYFQARQVWFSEGVPTIKLCISPAQVLASSLLHQSDRCLKLDGLCLSHWSLFSLMMCVCVFIPYIYIYRHVWWYNIHQNISIGVDPVTILVDDIPVLVVLISDIPCLVGSCTIQWILMCSSVQVPGSHVWIAITHVWLVDTRIVFGHPAIVFCFGWLLPPMFHLFLDNHSSWWNPHRSAAQSDFFSGLPWLPSELVRIVIEIRW